MDNLFEFPGPPSIHTGDKDRSLEPPDDAQCPPQEEPGAAASEPPESQSAGKARTPRGRFQKGRSGNPNGRPKGSRNAASAAAQQLLDSHALSITQMAIDAAILGDASMIRALLDRAVPRARSRRIALDLPPILTAGDVAAAIDTVLRAVGAGDITPDEGETVLRMLAAQRNVLDGVELEARVEALEAELKRKKGLTRDEEVG